MPICILVSTHTHTRTRALLYTRARYIGQRCVVPVDQQSVNDDCSVYTGNVDVSIGRGVSSCRHNTPRLSYITLCLRVIGIIYDLWRVGKHYEITFPNAIRIEFKVWTLTFCESPPNSWGPWTRAWVGIRDKNVRKSRMNSNIYYYKRVSWLMCVDFPQSIYSVWTYWCTAHTF